MLTIHRQTQSDGWYHSGTWAKAKTIMKHKISTLLAGDVPNDTDYIRVVNELPELIDNHNVHLAHFPKKTATPVEVKLAFQVRNAAKNYQWGNAHGMSKSGVRFSRYGYRGNNRETDGFDKEIDVEEEDNDDEYNSEGKIWEEEEEKQQQRQKTTQREESEPVDADSFEDEDDILSDE